MVACLVQYAGLSAVGALKKKQSSRLRVLAVIL